MRAVVMTSGAALAVKAVATQDDTRTKKDTPMTAERLDEFDANEWRDVARILRPDWTDEDFAREWAEFQATKAEHERKARLM